MIEFDATKPRIALTLDGRAEITFTAEKAVLPALEGLEGELTVSVGKRKRRRTLTQNAYLWVLIGKLAEKLGIGKSEVYRNHIRDCGSYEVVPIKAEAADRFERIWEGRGLGWACERIDSKLEGFVNIIAYYGSSTYDSKEMARLIDSVVRDCEEQGIQTMSVRDILLLENENDR